MPQSDAEWSQQSYLINHCTCKVRCADTCLTITWRVSGKSAVTVHRLFLLRETMCVSLCWRLLWRPLMPDSQGPCSLCIWKPVLHDDQSSQSMHMWTVWPVFQALSHGEQCTWFVCVVQDSQCTLANHTYALLALASLLQDCELL